MRSWAFVVLLACVGCVEHELVPCGDTLCPAGTMCTPAGTCAVPNRCGNHVTEAGEVCDDGNQESGDRCSATCVSDESCGNGIVDEMTPEECDDGNATDADGCSADCMLPRCGDSIVDPTEACDDGNQIADDGCSADCRSLEVCGNDIVDVANNEHCDEGVYGLSGDGCTSLCRAEYDLWRDITPAQLTARWGAQMVMHADRGELVMFGGMRSGQQIGATNETWVHRGGAWEPRQLATLPEPRYGHAMAYFVSRKQTYVFGGFNGPQHFNDVWQWDGTTWTKPVILGPTPSPRRYASLAYFPATDALVMYGGIDSGNNFLDDTWQFDGTKWTRITTTMSPGTNGGRIPYGKMFYQRDSDPGFSGLWLTGGSASDSVARTYHYIPGTGWELWITGPMSGFVEPAIVEMNHTTLWFSGRAPNDPTGQSMTADMYSFDGAIGEWIPVTPMSPPPARWSAAIASDGVTAVMFGGNAKSTLTQSTTYALRDPGTGWTFTLAPTTPTPSRRRAAAGVYDGFVGDIFMFGGAETESFNDTWRWATNVWKTVASPASPSVRWHPSLAFDEKRQEIVLFGGGKGCTGGGSGSDDIGCGSGGDTGGSGSGSSSEYYNDTWVLTQRWTEATVPAGSRPPVRSGAAMTYDPIAERVVLFGGQSSTGVRADAWAWNGATSTWTQLPSAPQAMTDARMVFDRANNTLMVYSGYPMPGRVWLFDGTTWQDVTPASGPMPRHLPVLVYHPLRRRVLLFGGKHDTGQLLADTWEWDGATKTWQERFPLQAPPLRFDAAAAYDPVDDRIVVLGGGGLSGNFYTDVWAYSFVENSPLVERCDGNDGDLDGLMACADPDCWGHCDPYCPPGAPVSCSPTRARCGDNVCSPLEHELYMLCSECTPTM